MVRKFTIADGVWLMLYIVLLAVITFGMFRARATILETFESPQTQEEWDQWREAVSQGQTDQIGPVKRKVPKSSQPPTLVLLRDHFYTCLAGLLVISSVLYGTIVFFLRGVMEQPGVSRNFK